MILGTKWKFTVAHVTCVIPSAKFPSDSYSVVIRRVNGYMTISTPKVNLCKICVRRDKRYRFVTSYVRKMLPSCVGVYIVILRAAAASRE